MRARWRSSSGTSVFVENSGAVSRLTGSADKLGLDLSSGAMFRGASFRAKLCDIEASSGAGVKVTVEEELNAKATSGASVQYAGKGVIKDIKVNSGGSVRRFEAEND